MSDAPDPGLVGSRGGGSPLLDSREARVGAALVLAAIVAVIWASLDPSGYLGVWHDATGGGVGPIRLPATLESWVDDGLMTAFFFVVGLELSREVVHGDLANRRAALLPVVAALGGMVGAALAYLAVAHRGEAAAGVGIPTATDIAFALGALAVLGPRVPPGLRLFVLALAVADDLGSLAVLVIGYSERLDLDRLGVALVTVVAMVVIRRLRVAASAPYIALGIVCWAALVGSGVEPALAGVAAGLAIPPYSSDPLDLEVRVERVTDWFVLPLFALANAGVALGSAVFSNAGATSVFVAVLVARVVGKCVGVTVATLVAARLTGARLPGDASVLQLLGVGLICGVGFTVPFLIADRAFAGEPGLLAAARVALLAGSVLAWLLGATVLLVAAKGRPGPQ